MKSWKVGLLLSYISIASASAALITPALPQIQQQFNLNHGQLEWIVTIFLIGYMLGQLIYGPLANHIGRLGALRVGFSINLFGIAICLLSSYGDSYAGLILGRFIVALGASAGLSCTFILLNESLDAERVKQALAFAVVSFTVGIGLAVLLGGIITKYLQWQDCFWLLGMHGIAALASTWLFAETLKQAKTTAFLQIMKGYFSAFRSPHLVNFSLLVGLVSLFSYCYAAAAPIIAHQVLHLNPAAYGYWNCLSILGMFFGALTASRLLKRYSNTIILQFSLGAILLVLLGLGLMNFTGTLGILSFFSISAALYFLCSMVFPAASHIATNAITDRAHASGAMNFINMGSAVLGVAIMGYLPFSRLWAFWFIVFGFCCLCLVVWAVLRDRV